MATDYKSCS